MELNYTYFYFIIVGIISAIFLAWNNPLENWDNYRYDEKTWTVFFLIMSFVGFINFLMLIVDLLRG